MPRNLRSLIFLLPLSSLLQAQISPISYQQSGSRLEQSFNGLPTSGTVNLTGKGPHALHQLPSTTGMQGWYILQMTVNQPNTTFSTSTGSATGSGVYSYGTSGQTNRALGSLAASSGVYAFGLALTNETGIILNRIKIRFLATQWRKGGSGNKNTWRFGYQYGDSARLINDTLIKNSRLDMGSIHTSSGAATLNGHLAINQLWIEDTITHIFWRPGETLILQWSDADETGSDDAMAVDDFSFIAFQQTALPDISDVTTDSIQARYAMVSALVNNQLTNTSVNVQIDTTANFLTAATVPDILPDSITVGSGTMKVIASIRHLLPGRKYYYRFEARNQHGIAYSNIQHFKTKTELPAVQTDSMARLDDNSCLIFGTVTSNGGDTILETGVCWGTDSLPTIHQNNILIAGADLNFQATIHQLPAGTKIFFRAYCKNAAGIAYGNSISWFTPTTILGFKRNGFPVTNKDTIIYEIQFKEKVIGITANNFKLLNNDIMISTITDVKENNLSWQIVIHTGNNDGSITPVFLNHNNYQPEVINTPFAANETIIDKTAPVIRSVQLPDKPYKNGDTILLTVTTHPEKKLLRLVSGNLLGYPLQQITKENDSCWKIFCVIKNGGQEINASSDITAIIVLSDEAGNQNSLSTFKIIQQHDAIDLTRPLIHRVFLPGKTLLKSGDSLLLQLQFTEPILLDSTSGSPLLSVTIGTRIRTLFLYRISNNTVFTFCYIVQPDEFDMDGIRIANSITLNNAILSDSAGNLLNNTIPNAGIFSNFRIDAVAPVITNVITPPARTYGIGDSLYYHVFFSEPVVLSSVNQFPHLSITVGNNLYQAVYLAGSTHPLKFYWIVQKGINDKNGIGLSNLLMNGEGITDSSGNPAEVILKNSGSVSNIFIDGIAPFFKDSILSLQACVNSKIQLTDVLKFADAETGETLRWTIFSPPTNGQIQGLPFSNRWVNENSLSANIFYTPTLSEAGVDECIIQLSDGVNTTLQKIKIRINPPIGHNTITANQMICAGFSAQPLKGVALQGGNGIYQFTWESGNTSTTYQKASGVYERETYHPLNLYSSAYFRRIVSSGNCIDTSNNIFIEVRSSGLWMGHQSNNWNAGTNWCGGAVPDAQTDVYINHADSKENIFINDSAFCRSLFIDTSQQLTINASLLFTGSLFGRYNIDAVNGTIIAAGKKAQLLQTSAFTNQSIARLIAAGTELDLADTLHIGEYFSIQKGIFNSKDLLLLGPSANNFPNASGTALKGKITTARNISGRQRNILIGHPFRNSLTIHLSPDSAMTSKEDIAVFYKGFSSNDSAYVINDTQTPDKYNPVIAWKPVIINNTAWQPGKGMLLSKPELSLPEKDTILLSLKGTILTGDVEIEYKNDTVSQYVLTGNPYLSPINSKYITRSEGIGNYYWVWDTSLAEHGAYRAKAFAANNTIATMTGFIIKTTPGKPLHLSYTEQSKQVSRIPDSLEALIENTYQLTLAFAKEHTVHDQLLILDVDSARIRYDAADAEKILNPESNLYSLSSDSIPLAVDARWMTHHTYIPLGLDTKLKGKCILRFTRVWLKPGIDLELYDLYTGNKIKIDTNTSYTFSITEDPASTGRNRFVIQSPRPPLPPEEVLELQVYPVPVSHTLTIVLKAREKANTTILIKNLQGQLMLSRNMGEQAQFTEQVAVGGLLSGQYIAEIHSGKYVIAKPFIKF